LLPVYLGELAPAQMRGALGSAMAAASAAGSTIIQVSGPATQTLPICLPAYLHSFIPTYLPAYLPTCLINCLPTCLLVYLPACLPTCLPGPCPPLRPSSCCGQVLGTRSLLGSATHWPLLPLLSALCALAQLLLLCTPLAPETPAWLAAERVLTSVAETARAGAAETARKQVAVWPLQDMVLL